MLTRLASAAWSTASDLARRAEKHGLLKSARLDARTISVGNLQVGGAGKTPLVALIARQAHGRGLKTCILCRGYGGEWEKDGGVIAPGEGAPEAALCGDEAALLHDLAPDAYIGIGADRLARFEAAKARAAAPFDVAILDDGFQHWRIRKDVEVVAVTSASRSRVLFRDWNRALDGADLVVWTKGEKRPEFRGKPWVRARFRLPDAGGGRPVCLVSGVADGAEVRRSAEEAGYSVAKHLVFPDHANYDESVVRNILESAGSEGWQVVLTGKDWVKWRQYGIPPSRVTVLEPEILFVEGGENWERVLWGS